MRIVIHTIKSRSWIDVVENNRRKLPAESACIKHRLSVDAHRHRATRPKASTLTSRQTHVHAPILLAAQRAVDRSRYIDSHDSITANICETFSPATRNYRSLRSSTDLETNRFCIFVLSCVTLRAISFITFVTFFFVLIALRTRTFAVLLFLKIYFFCYYFVLFVIIKLRCVKPTHTSRHFAIRTLNSGEPSLNKNVHRTRTLDSANA